MTTAKRLTKLLAATVALFVVAIICAPPSLAAPSVQISAFDGLSDGQKITVSGTGFEANLKQIAVGLCVEGYTGPNHCYLSGSTFRNADASGSIGEFEITVMQKFNDIDCAVDKCVIGIGPLPTTSDAATVAANSHDQPITFGAAAQETPPAADPAPADPGEAAGGELPKTGAGDLLPILVLGAGALLVVGLGLRIGFRQRGGLA